VSRRSTIWRRDGEDWVIVFHQVTLVALGKPRRADVKRRSCT
jgi:hypothetical protein